MQPTEIAPGRAVLPPRRRLRIALAIGVASGIYSWLSLRSARVEPDFHYWWLAARLLLAGHDPYAATPESPGWPLPDPFFYPVPAIFPVLPIAWLPMPIAGAIFMGLSGGLLAWVTVRDGTHRLWLFASGTYVMALKFGQWSPLLLAAAYLPRLGWLLPCKPQIGLPVFLHRPTRTAALLAAGSVAASFLVFPGWLSGWRTNVGMLEGHPAPILTPVGPILLLALLRWKTPEGRLFLAMCCVPQLLFFADQLPLSLVARTRRQASALSAASLLAFAGWYAGIGPNDYYVKEAAPWVLGLVYLPALAILLFGRRDAQPSDSGPGVAATPDAL